MLKLSAALQVEVKVNGFSETDQANLWHMLTDDQSKAKQGLGQSSVLKKVWIVQQKRF